MAWRNYMRKLLILDLDETLVFSTREPIDREPDFMVVGCYHAYKRPYLNNFLDYCFTRFRVAVWTSSSEDYAEAVVENVFEQKPFFLWARGRCTLRVDPETREYYWVKNLQKLKRKGYRLESILIIDDSPEKLQKNYGNHIRISPYFGRTDDDELLLLMQYLEMIRDCDNVRNLEKRDWKAKVKRLEDLP